MQRIPIEVKMVIRTFEEVGHAPSFFIGGSDAICVNINYDCAIFLLQHAGESIHRKA